MVNPYLRSVEEVLGYQISTLDDEIGAIKECYVCPPTWFIKYIEVETGSWFSKRRILITPETLAEVSWKEKSVSCNLARKDIEHAPVFEGPLTEAFEADINRYYNKVSRSHHLSA